MIYMQATLKLLPGKLQEFNEVMAKEFVPLAEKNGMKLVGSWATVLGLQDEVTDIWAFDSLTHFDQVTRTLGKDPQWWALVGKLRSLADNETLKILRPLPFSPIR